MTYFSLVFKSESFVRFIVPFIEGVQLKGLQIRLLNISLILSQAIFTTLIYII